MGSLSDSQANNLLDSRFGGVTTTAPATYYVALSTTLPTNTGTNVTEPVGNAYARVAVTKNATNFPTAAGRSISNGVAITFPSPTPSGWGVITHFALFDAATAGNFCGWGAFATATTVTGGGSAPVIPIGGMVITAP